VLLPVATLWLWAACAAICGQEAAEHSLAGASSAELTEMRDAPRCEGCPFTSFPKATASDMRASSEAGTQTPPPAPPSAPAALLQVSHPALARSRRPPPEAAPPLELLSTLRI
jgi:hypothetical protein